MPKIELAAQGAEHGPGHDGVLVTTGREIAVSANLLFSSTFHQHLTNGSFYEASNR